jgi:hypothetical protein
MSTQPPALKYLKDLFQSKHISQVAIIDDAYYATPPRSSFSGERLSELRVRIQSWEEPSQDFVGLQLKIDTDEDLTESHIGKLYAIRASSPEIGSWFRDYDNVQEQRRAQLRQLETMLKEELGCGVRTLSPADPLEPTTLPQLIFIDYYLDPSDRPEDSLALAESIGERLGQDFAQTTKPLVILMSSKEHITAIMKSQFRDRARLLGGMFYFIPKVELKPDPTLLLKLAILVRSLDEGHSIQDFVDAFAKELRGATEKFERKIRALSIEDYAYMQHLSLQGEGMPLGDYLLWLYGTYFGHLLFRSVPQQRRELDRMRFEVIPESDVMPSTDFVDLYRNVVAEEIDELGTHPRATANPEETNQPPDPHFGDVFVAENEKDALMVITAECDLMYAPEPEAKREHRPEQTVLMIPGELQEQSTASGCGDAATYFVPYRDKTYQIAWRVKNIEAPNFAGLRAFLGEKKLHRRLRLRHPFATQIQATFANDLNRIGIPIPPPMFGRCSLSICYRDADGQTQHREMGTNSAVLYTNRSGDEHVHLKLKVVAQIVEVAKICLAPIDAQIAAETDENAKLRLNSSKERLSRFLDDLESQMKLRQPVSVRANKSLAIPGTPVEILRDPTKLDARLTTTPIVVLVSDATAGESED